MRHLFAASWVLALAAQGAAAQSLGDAAKREQERREKNKKAGVTAPKFNDDSVKHASPAPAAAAAGAGAKSDAGEKRNLPTDLGGGIAGNEIPDGEIVSDPNGFLVRREDYWRHQVLAARNRVEAAQRRLDDLKSTWWLPGRGLTGTLQDETKAAEAQLRAAKAALQDLEDRARRESVPPGWLR